jgi:putative MATE family efflux protein
LDLHKKRPLPRAVALFGDAAYFQQLLFLAAPIALQNLLANSLYMVGNVMVGQLGDASMAAVGLAGQVFFLLNLVLFGIGSGSAMFTAQLWGNKDIVNLRKVVGLCLILGIGTSILFLSISEFFPAQILEIFTEDPLVVSLGSEYLRLVAWAFVFFSITSGFGNILRSVGEVKIPMVVSVSSLAFTVVLSYLLIFGKFGLPALGIQGAALSNLIARIFECLALVLVTYHRKLPVAAKFSEMIGINWAFIAKVFKPVLPVILNELFWSLGITAYSFVYARIGTGSIAAMNIVGTVDNMAFVPFLGLSSGIAIMTGNMIGAGEKEKAYRNVGRALVLTALLGLVVGCIAVFSRGSILALYKVSPEVVNAADRALIILGCWMVVRSLNMVIVVGMLRSGGDTRFSLFLDGTIIWILGVPMAMLGGFILHLPVYWVYLFVMSEELTKCILGLRRYFSRKWIHDLTQTVKSPLIAETPPLQAEQGV